MWKEKEAIGKATIRHAEEDIQHRWNREIQFDRENTLHLVINLETNNVDGGEDKVVVDDDDVIPIIHRISWSWAVCSFALLAVAYSRGDPYEYNVTSYTRNLPDEIRPIVSRALRVERAATHPNFSSSDCHPDDQISCPPMKYRRPSGECNNVRHPKWGNRGSAFLRLLPPSYADGE
ncbi:uncharacterized protein LOC111692685 [Anoplophora glabripennis]|uniref:uncharacterized protein LOC111692685 n=1 Tax=Anoplophora glabripennis TaxID=217634 RepID=UPI000C75D865|nr:uncharacterized protein LOC111692685 [Anoplophora glabripennis]